MAYRSRFMRLVSTVYNKSMIARRACIRNLRKVVAPFVLRRSYEQLAQEEPTQKGAFDALCEDFAHLYIQASRHVPEELLMPQWNDINRGLENVFLPQPPFAFLRLPLIEYSMAGNTYDSFPGQALAYIKSRISAERLRTILHEDPVGGPRLSLTRYCTSGNSIRSLYSICRFQAATRVQIADLSTIVEWGGGYGNFAKIFSRVHRGACTYILIDTPLFSCVQWLYLSTIFGRDRVKFITENDAISRGKFNIVPLSQLGKLPSSCDLFVSTWALNESAPQAQDLVAQKHWFGATHLLLAYMRNHPPAPTSESVGIRAVNHGARAEDAILHPGSFFAFK